MRNPKQSKSGTPRQDKSRASGRSTTKSPKRAGSGRIKKEKSDTPERAFSKTSKQEELNTSKRSISRPAKKENFQSEKPGYSRLPRKESSETPGKKYTKAPGRETSKSTKQDDFKNSKQGYSKGAKQEDAGIKNPKSPETRKPYLKKEVQIPKETGQGDLIRLNKYIANAGICSRREADRLIESGIITVNGVVITSLGTKIHPTDRVQYDGQVLKTEKKYYVLLNKPKGFLTTTDDPFDRKTVMYLVKDACKERIYPVGRLDKNTTGVLLLTNDGEMAKKLTHPKYSIKKIYHVLLDKNITKTDLQKIQTGVQLEDGFMTVDKIAFTTGGDSKKELGLELHSGKNRIVRRIFESLGYDVVKLDRVMFSSLTKKDLPRGTWRHLTEKEVNFLQMLRSGKKID